jgi:hypothetical protein
MDASKFQQCRRYCQQNFQIHKKPFFLCIHGLSVYRVHINEGIRMMGVYRVSMYT